MISKDLTVLNELGIHARVASRIVREARRFECSVVAQKEGKTFDFKNITGVITVNAKRDAVVHMEFDGADEQAACEAFTILFANKFGER